MEDEDTICPYCGKPITECMEEMEKDLKTGKITTNEARVHRGLPAIEGFDFRARVSNVNEE
ncbi:MAG: hypothetical protein FWG88_05195 [Oscillospiraceae bacterium]|nr:hypothetical protein [Oscillospiraceae bacterium]